MQASAWDHASQRVQDLVTLMATMSDYRQGAMEITARFSLSLADAIVLEHRLMEVKITLLVDPWRYPGEETPASAVIKWVLQSAVDKATAEGKHFGEWTAESMSAYLLSPLLLPKGKRPSLVRARLERAAPDSALGAAGDDAPPGKGGGGCGDG